MSVEEFLELFIGELESNVELRHYYRLLDKPDRFLWRKAYLQERLQYIADNLPLKEASVWDVGCGFATTSIFLTLNGYQVLGNTLEFYYDKINGRLDYWSRYGNLDKLKIEYANLYDMPVIPEMYDIVIAQDTLHHLEPVKEALTIFRTSLKDNGRMIVIEENGNCLFINLKNISQRGFTKVSRHYDERLEKTVLFGNENARSIKAWTRIFEHSGLMVPAKDIRYIRLYPPFCYTQHNYAHIPKKEYTISQRHKIIREILYFGINFTANKVDHSK